MATQPSETQQTRQPVSPVMLFLIGLTAGLIAASFPRIVAYMSVSESDVNVHLFSTGYLLASGIFAVTIGVSMIWFYMGSREHTKHLFLAALAMPSVLSGGINMSSSVSNSKDAIQVESADKVRLQKSIESSLGIVEAEVSFNTPAARGSQTQGSLGAGMLAMAGISLSHAADTPSRGRSTFDAGVKYSIKTEQLSYVLSLYKSKDQAEVQKKLDEYLKKGATNLTIRQGGDWYYLVTQQEMSRTDSLLEAVALKNKLSVTPTLLRVK